MCVEEHDRIARNRPALFDPQFPQQLAQLAFLVELSGGSEHGSRRFESGECAASERFVRDDLAARNRDDRLEMCRNGSLAHHRVELHECQRRVEGVDLCRGAAVGPCHVALVYSEWCIGKVNEVALHELNIGFDPRAVDIGAVGASEVAQPERIGSDR